MFSKTGHALILLIFLPMLLLAQEDSSRFIISKKKYSVEDGLASREVFCGLQDYDGLLWFGTRNGLNCFNGNNFELFTKQRNGLQGNKIVQMAIDDDNHLFLEYGVQGYQRICNGQIDVMDLKTHKIKRLGEMFPSMPFKESDVYWISNDGSREINILTKYPYKIWKYSSAHGFTLRYEMSDWVEQHEQVNLISGESNLFQHGTVGLKLHSENEFYVIGKSRTAKFKSTYPGCAMVALTQSDELLLALNPLKTTASSYHFGVLNHQNQIQLISGNEHAELNCLDGKELQFNAAIGDASCMLYHNAIGLFIWKNNQLIQLENSNELKALPNLVIYTNFEDQLGKRWVCTSNGLMRFKTEQNHFQHYFTRAQQNVELNNQVRGIYLDNQNRLYANIWNYLFTSTNGRTQTKKFKDINYALCGFDNTVLIAGYDYFTFDVKSQQLTHFPSMSMGEVWSTYVLNNHLFLSGRTKGIAKLDIQLHREDAVNYLKSSIPKANFVYRFQQRKDSTLWAVAENGLYLLTKQGDVADFFGIENQFQLKGQSLNFGIHDAYEDSSGIVWIATNGEGLYRWDRVRGEMKQFTVTAGLPSDILYRIEEDRNHFLWISTDDGLLRFNTQSFDAYTYRTHEGLSHNEFNRASSFQSKDGRIFFGGLNGVNAFYPHDLTKTSTPLNIPFKVISYSKFSAQQGKLLDYSDELRVNPQIRLEPGDDFFTIEFSLLDYEEHSHHYAYKIEGIDKDWNYINENSIRISGLPYGKFLLTIKAQTINGEWSNSLIKIPIHIIRPFYKAWWFTLLLVLLGIAGLVLFVIVRTNQLRLAKVRLEKEVNKRTKELEKSLAEEQTLLNEKEVLIKEIHHRVKNNLQVISGLLELQEKGLSDEAAKQALMEGRNRVRSVALIHQNLYQFENLSQIELRSFVEDLYAQVCQIFTLQSQQAHLKIEISRTTIDIDTAIPFGLILNELLTNTFKYGRDVNGQYSIQLTLQETSLSNHGRKFIFIYSDSGPGLPTTFDVKSAKSLGMLLIYDLSKQIGGGVLYDNSNGSKFTLTFFDKASRKKNE